MHSFILWAPSPNEYFVPDVNVTEQGPFFTSSLADKQGPSEPLCFRRESSGGGLFIHMIEPASTREKAASVLPFASAHRSVTPSSRGSIQDQAQNCYTSESWKKSLPELSRNLIPMSCLNTVQISLLRRSKWQSQAVCYDIVEIIKCPILHHLTAITKSVWQSHCCNLPGYSQKQCPLWGAWGRQAKNSFQHEQSQGVCGGFRLVASTVRNLGDDNTQIRILFRR